MRGWLALAVAGAIVGAGCQTITITNGEVGSGKLKSEDRAVTSITEIQTTASVITRVTIGAPASLRVTADDNLLDNVSTRVSGTRLEIAIRGSVQTRNPVVVELVVPELAAGAATASARLELAAVDSASLRLTAESSGVVTVSGRVAELDARGTSSGRLELRDLESSRATVRLDSSAQAWVRAAERITGDVSSSAVLTVLGDPGSVDVTTSSSGRIERE
jgi:hypothetical protein